MNDIIEVNNGLSREKLLEFLKIAGIAQKLTEQERLQFVEIAQAYQLNPFKREIYCNTYGQGQYRTTSIITGYEVYIKRAERTGKLNGWKVDIEGSVKDNSLKAIITIYRKDWEQPFTHEVYFEEVCQKTKDGRLNSIWGKMPRFMTKKVAIAQGFRLCFSDELGGMPYTSDELPQEEKQPVQAVSTDTKKLSDEEKSTLENATSEKELVEGVKKLAEDKPAARAEIVKLYNSRLAELNKPEEGITEVEEDDED